MSDDIRQRHARETLPEGRTDHECIYCDKPWPCDAIRMADARDEWEAHSRRWMEHAGKVAAERDAANADADRLAEALRDVLMSHSYDISDNAAHAINEDARAALAAHEERVR